MGNQFGEAITKASVLVEKKKEEKNPPGKPGKPTIEDWDNKSVDLKWSPAAENGAPITSYIIEAKCGVAGSWEDVFESDGAGTKCTVPNLKEGATYQFRVRAKNKAGPGEAGESTSPHICKHRNLKPHINRDKL